MPKLVRHVSPTGASPFDCLCKNVSTRSAFQRKKKDRERRNKEKHSKEVRRALVKIYDAIEQISLLCILTSSCKLAKLSRSRAILSRCRARLKPQISRNITNVCSL